MHRKEILGYGDTALFGVYSLNSSAPDNFCQFIILVYTCIFLFLNNKNNKTCYSCFLLILYFLISNHLGSLDVTFLWHKIQHLFFKHNKLIPQSSE